MFWERRGGVGSGGGGRCEVLAPKPEKYKKANIWRVNKFPSLRGTPQTGNAALACLDMGGARPMYSTRHSRGLEQSAVEISDYPMCLTHQWYLTASRDKYTK